MYIHYIHVELFHSLQLNRRDRFKSASVAHPPYAMSHIIRDMKTCTLVRHIYTVQWPFMPHACSSYDGVISRACTKTLPFSPPRALTAFLQVNRFTSPSVTHGMQIRLAYRRPFWRAAFVGRGKSKMATESAYSPVPRAEAVPEASGDGPVVVCQNCPPSHVCHASLFPFSPD